MNGLRISRRALRRTIPVWRVLPTVVAVLLATLTGAPGVLAQSEDKAEFSFTFEDDAEGWTVGFADLPVDYEQSIFELDHGHRPLPDGLEGSGIYIQGHNRSDDLFMFLTRQVGGLREDATYMVAVSVDLATNVPANSFGIGGSPGTSVYVKAGASTVEPETVHDRNRYLRMNIDKANQSQGGESMVALGNVAHPDVVGGEYRIKTLDNPDRPLTVETDGEGRVWLIVGTDSGFEGLTALYYDRISYTLRIMELPSAGGFSAPVWAVALLAGIGATLAALGLTLLRRVRRRRLSETQ